MKFKAIFYPLICVALLLFLATFLVVKHQIDHSRTNQPTATETSVIPAKVDDENLNNITTKPNQTRPNEKDDDSTSLNQHSNQAATEDENINSNNVDAQEELISQELINDEDFESNILPIVEADIPVKEYAKSLSLNCKKEISLATNETIFLTDNFVTVFPAQFLSDLEIKILKNSELTNDLMFENNKIFSSVEGDYQICFSIKTGENTFKTKQINVHVTENCTHAKLIQPQLELAQNFALNSVVQNFSNGKMEVFIDETFIKIENEILTPLKLGETKLKVRITDENCVCEFVFDISVQLTSKFEIVFPDLSNNTFSTTKSTVGINYQINYGNQEYVNQDIIAEIDDGYVAQIISADAPIVFVKRKSKGRVNLKLTFAAYPEISTTITIIFE